MNVVVVHGRIGDSEVGQLQNIELQRADGSRSTCNNIMNLEY